MSLTRFRCANSLREKMALQHPSQNNGRANQNQNQGAVRESNPRPLPPEGRIIPLDQRPSTASNEDRTRDLLLTRQMLCQLSYRGEGAVHNAVIHATGTRTTNQKKKKVNTGSVTAARLSGRLTLH